ncbi:hypothetical protein L9F63_006875, partial [Diploptera punctata]
NRRIFMVLKKYKLNSNLFYVINNYFIFISSTFYIPFVNSRLQLLKQFCSFCAIGLFGSVLLNNCLSRVISCSLILTAKFNLLQIYIISLLLMLRM